MKSQKRTLTLCTVVVATALAALATPAFAEETTTTTTTTTEVPPVKHVGRSSGDVGSGGLGVGATAFVSGLAGPEVVYDFGIWHIEGMLGFQRTPTPPNGTGPSATAVDFGVGGWYHLHLGQSSDFSIGGAFGLLTFSPGMGASTTAFEFEPGAQVRAFITPNVALHAGMAVVFEFGDQVGLLNKSIILGGQLTANFGFTYFFR
jgi:hypothetical protein